MLEILIGILNIIKEDVSLTTRLGNVSMVNLYAYRRVQQAHRNTIIAFHLGVYIGIVIYIFSKQGKV